MFVYTVVEKDESIRIFCVYKFLMRVETFFKVNNLYTVRNNVVCCVKNADCQKRFFVLMLFYSTEICVVAFRFK